MPTCAFCEDPLPDTETTVAAACSPECFDAWDVIVCLAEPHLQEHQIGDAITRVFGQFEDPTNGELLPGTTNHQVEQRLRDAFASFRRRGHVAKFPAHVRCRVSEDGTEATVNLVYINVEGSRRGWRMYLGNNKGKLDALNGIPL